MGIYFWIIWDFNHPLMDYHCAKSFNNGLALSCLGIRVICLQNFCYNICFVHTLSLSNIETLVKAFALRKLIEFAQLWIHRSDGTFSLNEPEPHTLIPAYRYPCHKTIKFK